jgi:small subunit ribosomal protein S17
MENTKVKAKKTIQGKVVSVKMSKTIVMEFEVRQVHPIFKKITRKTTRLKVHDEKGECGEGDIILAEETRPLSREKRHTLKSIIEKAK